MNNWLALHEPTWLFFGIYGEILITLIGTFVSTVYIAKRINTKRQSKTKKKDSDFESLNQGEGK